MDAHEDQTANLTTRNSCDDMLDANETPEISPKATEAYKSPAAESEGAVGASSLATITEDDNEVQKNGTGNAAQGSKLDDMIEMNGEIGEAKRKKKKKSKTKSKMSKGLGKPTGFEEYFADAPLTAAEVNENRNLFDPSIPVEERIQTAVQRFSARRRFESALKEVFDRYLVFGGVDSGPNMFGGSEDLDACDLTAAEIAQLKNTKYLNDAVIDGDMVVDFDAVLKAFLSSHSAVWFTIETKAEINRRMNVIRSFLNYLLHHDVCPEYEGQIWAAKDTCDVGESQLEMIGKLGRTMPGSFNISCSVLFHGWYHDCYINQLGNGEPEGEDDRIVTSQRTFQAALASHASWSICENYQRDNAEHLKQPLRSFHTGLEVLSIEPASKEVRELYDMSMFADCKPTGKMRTRVWHSPASFRDDISKAEEEQRLSHPPKLPEYEFWLEEDILCNVFPGLKFEAQVYELTFGVFFFDQPVNFRCSFFTWLPNEAMIGYREHEYLPPRPPLVGCQAETDAE